MQLASAEIGKKCIVRGFSCPCDIRMRMIHMGLFPGCPVEIISRINGSMLVRIGESRLMLDGCLANQIQVG